MDCQSWRRGSIGGSPEEQGCRGSALRPGIAATLEDDRSELLGLCLLIGEPVLLLLGIGASLLKILVVGRLKLIDVLPPISLQRTRVNVGVILHHELASPLKRGQR